jgi:hypothetical protein
VPERERDGIVVEERQGKNIGHHITVGLPPGLITRELPDQSLYVPKSAAPEFERAECFEHRGRLQHGQPLGPVRYTVNHRAHYRSAAGRDDDVRFPASIHESIVDPELVHELESAAGQDQRTLKRLGLGRESTAEARQGKA